MSDDCIDCGCSSSNPPSHHPSCPASGVSERMSDAEFDTRCTDYPVCPHCGYEHTNWEFQGDEEGVSCESCGELMDVETNRSVYYSTEKAPPRCALCRGEKDRPGQVGFKPEGGVLRCTDSFHDREDVSP